MTKNIIFSTFIALILSFFAVYWFATKQSNMRLAEADVPTVIVIQPNGYQPSLIHIPAGKTVSLHFLRKDMSACASSVIFPQLNFSYQLQMNKVTNIVLPAQKSGDLDFTCQAGSYRGKILVL